MGRGRNQPFDDDTVRLLRAIHNELKVIKLVHPALNEFLRETGRGEALGLSLTGPKKDEFVSEGTVTAVLGVNQPSGFVPQASGKYWIAFKEFAEYWHSDARGNQSLSTLTVIAAPQNHSSSEPYQPAVLRIKPNRSKSNLAIDGFVVPIEFSLSTETQLKTSPDKPAEVTLDAEFNPFNYHPNVKFGFKKMRLKVTVPESPIIQIASVLAAKEPVQIAGGQLQSNGVVGSTTWDITLNRAFEPCTIATTDAALFEVTGLSDGMIIESKIAVKLEDSVIDVDPTSPAAANTNARALMDFLCSQEAVRAVQIGNYCVISEGSSYVEIEGL
jgi:hypothetical protein